MPVPQTFEDAKEEFELLSGMDEEQYKLLLDLGRALEPMPDALKTPTTKVPGCVADVWAYPIRKEDGTLHFLADSNALTTKGLIALVLLIVQDKSPQEILHTDIEGKLGSLALNTKTQLTGNRASNLPNMIRLIRETATRLAA